MMTPPQAGSFAKDIRIKLLIFVIVVFIFFSVFYVIFCDKQNNLILRDVLSGKTCKEVCWHGIELLAEEQILLEMLNRSNFDFSVIREVLRGETHYTVKLPSDSLLLDSHEQVRDISVLVVQGKIGRILIPSDVCISTMVHNYGIPKVIQIETDYFEFVYPDNGISFMSQVNSGRVYLIDIVGKRLAVERVESLEDQSLSFESLMDMLKNTDKCIDSFSKSD